MQSILTVRSDALQRLPFAFRYRMLLERIRNKEGEIRVSSKVKVLIADDEVLVRIGVIHAIDWEKMDLKSLVKLRMGRVVCVWLGDCSRI